MKDKKQQVEQMFDSIAGRYDFLNHFLSLGIDRCWRKRVAKIVAADAPCDLLDVATGTADMAIALHRAGVKNIVGVDLSEGMLAVGRKKIERLGLDIKLVQGEAEILPVPDCSFDAVTCAFGARNFADILSGLTQMHRVLRDKKNCYILEYSKAEKRTLVSSFFALYFRHILPTVGGWISGNKAAYSYLPDSVEAFAAGEEFCDLMRSAGFENCSTRTLLGGWVTIYIGKKR